MTARSRLVFCLAAGLAVGVGWGCGDSGSGDDTDADGTEFTDVPVEGDVPVETDSEAEAETGPECGNGEVEGDEACDDGNDTAGDGCEADCTWSCEEADDTCPPEEHCEDATHTCRPGCRSDEGCAAAAEGPWCDVDRHLCVECLLDSQCDAGSRCVDFACVAGCVTSATCGAGEECCDEACVDTQTSATHCGACGTACEPANGFGECVAGACGIDDCETDFADCDGLYDSGCEVDVTTDLANCGACGTACPDRANAVSDCTGSACGFTCTDPWLDCDAAADTGCEVDPTTDVANCGACGAACAAPANGTAGCAASACTIAACDGGYADCDLDVTTGCEVALATDPANCGVCGTICPAPANATPGCALGVCGIGACTGAYADCNLSAADGCEVDSLVNPAHCGACGTVCGPYAHATAGCAAGACILDGCDADFDDCNGTVADGCEAALLTDEAHCGACGTACTALQTCVRGACGVVPTNDTRAGATVIALASPAVSLVTDTRFASNDTTGSCGCTDGADVFYRFTLTQAEMVYADTVGASWDTSLFLQDSTGANITAGGTPGANACNDDNGMGCSTGLQSMIAARLAAGTYYLVLSGCGSGTATIHFQHLPVGSGGLAQVNPTTTTAQTVTGTTSGTGVLNGGCCSGGPESSYWFVTCPAFAATPLQMTTCGGATWDTDLEQRSAARATPTVCNDDSCDYRSNLTGSIPAGAGLHTFSIDGCGSAAGAYSLGYLFGTCGAGTNLCAVGGCRDLQTDPSNCGACGTVCGAGLVCEAGTCRIPTFGSGSDGALTVASGTTTINAVQTTITAGSFGASTLTVASATGLAAGQLVFLHNTQGGVSVGCWQVNRITGVTGTTVTLAVPLACAHSTGAGAVAQLVVMPQYTAVTLSGGTLTAPAWNGATGGILAFAATGLVQTTGGRIDMATRGFRGPARPGTNYTPGRQGEGYAGVGAANTAANGNGGGGGGRTGCECCWGGTGGGGGYGRDGIAGPSTGTCQVSGALGPAVGGATQSLIFFGGAGGAGGADEDGYGAAGGNGGGLVYLAGRTVTMTSGGLSVNGAAGGAEYNFSGCGSGGGGGGAGGAVYLQTTGTAALGAGLVTSNGGPGGDDPSNCGYGGGAGGVGRVTVRGAASVTGSTVPVHTLVP